MSAEPFFEGALANFRYWARLFWQVLCVVTNLYKVTLLEHYIVIPNNVCRIEKKIYEKMNRSYTDDMNSSSPNYLTTRTFRIFRLFAIIFALLLIAYSLFLSTLKTGSIPDRANTVTCLLYTSQLIQSRLPKKNDVWRKFLFTLNREYWFESALKS